MTPSHPVHSDREQRTEIRVLTESPATARPRGGPFRVPHPTRSKGIGRPKSVVRHVAEIDALVAAATLDDIVTTSRAAITSRLQFARAEVKLNVWRSSAFESRM